MKKVGNEWQWFQTHSCGHKTYQAVYGGKRPDAARSSLAGKVCPKCNLIDLLGEHYGVRAAEDITAIREGTATLRRRGLER
jgi:hypothetical protein